MKVTNKIKGLLAINGFNFADYARKLNILPQTLNNKAKQEAYKVKDLIALAELTNTQLAFIDNKGKPVITFDSNDLSD